MNSGSFKNDVTYKLYIKSTFQNGLQSTPSLSSPQSFPHQKGELNERVDCNFSEKPQVTGR